MSGTLGSQYAQPTSRKPPARVQVYNDSLYDQLIQQSQVETLGPLTSTSSFRGGKTTSSTFQGTQASHLSQASHATSRRARDAGSVVIPTAASKKQLEEKKKELRYRNYQIEMIRREAEKQRCVKERLASQKAAKEAEYKTLHSDVVQGTAFVQELDRIMDIADSAEHIKRSKQHKEWSENVYAVIQNKINEQVDAISSTSLNKMKCQDYQKFLNATASNAPLFRDIIIESQYAPLEVNKRAIKANVGTLIDPTSRPVDRYMEESGMLGGTSDAPKVKPPTSRVTLDTKEWATGRIEDTTHGFMARMLSKAPKAPRSNEIPVREGTPPAGVSSIQHTSTSNIGVNFDHYNVATGWQVTQEEFPRGKKTYPRGEIRNSNDKPRHQGKGIPKKKPPKEDEAVW